MGLRIERVDGDLEWRARAATRLGLRWRIARWLLGMGSMVALGGWWVAAPKLLFMGALLYVGSGAALVQGAEEDPNRVSIHAVVEPLVIEGVVGAETVVRSGEDVLITVGPDFPTGDLHAAVERLAQEAGVAWQDTRSSMELLRYEVDPDHRATRQLEGRLLASKRAAPALYERMVALPALPHPHGLRYEIVTSIRRISVELVRGWVRVGDVNIELYRLGRVAAVTPSSGPVVIVGVVSGRLTELVRVPRRGAAEALWLAARLQQAAQQSRRGRRGDVPAAIRALQVRT